MWIWIHFVYCCINFASNSIRRWFVKKCQWSYICISNVNACALVRINILFDLCKMKDAKISHSYKTIKWNNRKMYISFCFYISWVCFDFNSLLARDIYAYFHFEFVIFILKISKFNHFSFFCLSDSNRFER